VSTLTCSQNCPEGEVCIDRLADVGGNTHSGGRDEEANGLALIFRCLQIQLAEVLVVMVTRNDEGFSLETNMSERLMGSGYMTDYIKHMYIQED